MPQDIKDANSSLRSRKHQKRRWNRPLKVTKCVETISSSGNASVAKGWRLGEYMEKVPQKLVLFYILPCHSPFGDSWRHETQLDGSLIQYSCSSALKLKTCISVTLSMARERGKRTRAVPYKEKLKRLRVFSSHSGEC